MDGYLLKGIDDEILVVFRSFDEAEVTALIKRLSGIRDKGIKELALEEELYGGHYRNNEQLESQDTSEGSRSKRGGSRKTANPKRRTDPGT